MRRMLMLLVAVLMLFSVLPAAAETNVTLVETKHYDFVLAPIYFDRYYTTEYSWRVTPDMEQPDSEISFVSVIGNGKVDMWGYLMTIATDADSADQMKGYQTMMDSRFKYTVVENGIAADALAPEKIDLGMADGGQVVIACADNAAGQPTLVCTHAGDGRVFGLVLHTMAMDVEEPMLDLIKLIAISACPADMNEEEQQAWWKEHKLNGEEPLPYVEPVPLVAITADRVTIRTAPDISADKIQFAYKDETYKHIRDQGDFYVIDVEGREGYVHQGVCEFIPVE
ncbi:MAG: SH3 domain-containing protein [Clostridia bacterium]|nr:SH3 domain-containing protein [Clostridia bacterium]